MTSIPTQVLSDDTWIGNAAAASDTGDDDENDDPGGGRAKGRPTTQSNMYANRGRSGTYRKQRSTTLDKPSGKVRLTPGAHTLQP